MQHKSAMVILLTEWLGDCMNDWLIDWVINAERPLPTVSDFTDGNICESNKFEFC